MNALRALRQIRAVAVTEWKLQTRTLVFWAALAIAVLYAVGRIVGAPAEFAFLQRQWIANRESAALWIGMVLIFLAPSALARDRRTARLVWTTPVPGGVYAAGKLLGVWLVALTIVAFELAAQAAVRVPAWPLLTAEAFSEIFRLTALGLVPILYITSVFFFVAVIVYGQPLAAYLISAVYLGITFFRANDPANPLGFIPASIFDSDLVGYGPESQIVGSHSLLYLALTPAVAALALLAYSWRERRSLFLRWQRLFLLGGLLLVLGAILWAGVRFAQDQARILAPPGAYEGLRTVSLSVEDVTPAMVQSVRVDVSLDPAAGKIEGEVALSTAPGLSNLAIYVPPSLTLTATTDCRGGALRTAPVNAEFVQVTPDSPQMCLSFAGAWQPPRLSYQYYNVRPPEVEWYTGAYIGQGYVYLTPYARWYPAPIGSWEWQAPHQIAIRLPRATTAVISSAHTTGADEEWVTHRWQSAQGKPRVSLAAGQYQLALGPAGYRVWAAPEHLPVAEAAADFFFEYFQTTGRLLGLEGASYQIIETPVLRRPIIQEDLIFLPESYFLDALVQRAGHETTFQRLARTDEREAVRQEVYREVRGLLSGQVFFADPPLVEVQAVMYPPNPSPDVGTSYVPLRESLAHYLTLQAVDAAFDTYSLNEALQVRFLYADRYVQDLAVREMYPFAIVPGFPELPGYPFDRGWAFNQLFAGLGKLEQRVGRTEVNRMIGLLLKQHAGGDVLTSDWLDIIEQGGGREAREVFEATCGVPHCEGF